MDGGEIEMSSEELRSWIRDKVKKTQPFSSVMLEKCSELQSLLQRREKHAANLLKLCESVAACEETVRKLYSLLGWEYMDTDCEHYNVEDDIYQASCGQASLLSGESVYSETQVPRPLTSAGPASALSKLKDSKTLGRGLRRKYPLALMRKAVVVLTRLPASQIISTLPPSLPENDWSEDESVTSADLDRQWEPDTDSSDSDFSDSSARSKKKRKKTSKTKEKGVKSHKAHRASKNSITNGSSVKTVTQKNFQSAESNVATTSTPKVSAVTSAKSKTAKSTKADTSMSAKSQAAKSSTLAASTTEETPSTTVSAVTQSSAIKTPPAVTQEELKVNMKVLARRSPLCWQRGTLVEIITKEDGRVKYKVNFVEKGKRLVSGYHIAFDHMPKVHQLVVGTRVVVKTEDGQFKPGIVGEVPSRKNRMRFLVFIDDHTPTYVGLPLIYLVCERLQDPLDDILDEKHKTFMQIYLKRWPYPPQSQYKDGQTVNIEFNGCLQRTKILQVDCSLIQVVFLNDNHKEWVYRGSSRLEQMALVNENSVSK